MVGSFRLTADLGASQTTAGGSDLYVSHLFVQ